MKMVVMMMLMRMLLMLMTMVIMMLLMTMVVMLMLMSGSSAKKCNQFVSSWMRDRFHSKI